MFSKTFSSQPELEAFAKTLARYCRTGDVLALYGSLGAGKTVFSRAFIRSLSNKNEEVPSPTFTLVQTYDVQTVNGEETSVWHFDLYRLKEAQEVYELGFEEALSGGISLIEWPERAGRLLPRSRLEIKIDTMPHSPDERRITLHPCEQEWEKRLEEINTCLNA